MRKSGFDAFFTSAARFPQGWKPSVDVAWLALGLRRGRGGSHRGGRRSRRSRARRSGTARGGSRSAAARSSRGAFSRGTAGLRAAVLSATAAAAMTEVVEQAVVTTAVAATGVSRGAAVRSARATTIAGAGAAMATMTSEHRIALTAHEGDANHREEDRDAKNKCTIHPKFLQQNRYRTERNTQAVVRVSAPRSDGRLAGLFAKPTAVCHLLASGSCPVNELFRLAHSAHLHRLGRLSYHCRSRCQVPQR